MFKKIGLLLSFIIIQWSCAVEHIVTEKNVNIWYETFGNQDKPPLLLIMGGGCQGIMWPREFCEKLAKSFFVIRYDHRDVGLSTPINFEQNPYDLEDMADDALHILEDCHIKKAYIFGTSMGGMIAQILAAEHPDLIKGVAIMSSTTDLGVVVDAIEGNRNLSSLPSPSKEYLDWINSIIKIKVETDEERIEQHLSGWRVLNGKRFPFDENIYRKLIIEQLSRQGENEENVNNHIRAIKLWCLKNKKLPKIQVPLYVFWGDQDPIFNIKHAQSIIDQHGTGELFVIEGMGHNLNKALYDPIASKIRELFLES